jgi:ketosteroid isomerase-like protein
VSQENIETFRRGVEAYNRGDLEGQLGVAHPNIEWYPLTAQVEGGQAFHGHEGIREWWSNLDATFEGFAVSFDEVRDLDDAVLALGRVHLRFKGGVILDREGGYFARFRDGLIVWARQYPSRDEALEAAGLSE